MDYKQVIIGILILILIGIVLNMILNPPLRVCPDAWYQDKMPQVHRFSDYFTFWVDDKKEWFVINGTRIDNSEIDVDWVKENCNIKPRVAY